MQLAVVGPSLDRIDEAQALEAQVWCRRLGATLITHPTPRGGLMSLPGKLMMARVYQRQTRRFDLLILPGTITNRLFDILPADKCVPLLSTRLTDEAPSRVNAFAERARRFPCVLAQSPSLVGQLAAAGVPAKKVHVVLPLVEDVRPQAATAEPRSLLFASSPNGPAREMTARMAAKGVDLLLDAIRDQPLRLVLLWRGDYVDELARLVDAPGKRCQIEIVDRLARTGPHYAASSAVVIPYRSLSQSRDYPLSAIEGLSHGRPVVSTNVPEIHRLLQQEECGVVSDPDVPSFRRAIASLEKLELSADSCRAAFEKHFLVDRAKLDRLRSILESVGA